MNAPGRRYRAGESLEDFCRACKTDRMHTVIAADGEGQPIRVACGYCHSEHNYRGGPRVGLVPGTPRAPDAIGEPKPAGRLFQRRRVRAPTASRFRSSANVKGQVRQCPSMEPTTSSCCCAA